MECVIPAHNAEHTIVRAIESARIAGASKCLVVDDGSRDRTAELARLAGASVITQLNAGASVARRVGLQQVQSEFVVFLDADDQLAPGILDALAVLQEFERCAVVGGRIRLLYESGKSLIGPELRPVYSLEDILAQPVSPWPPAAAVWRTRLVREAFNMSPEMLMPRYAEDYELLVRASTVGEVRSVPSVTSTYSASGGKSHAHVEKSIADAMKIQQYYAAQYEVEYRAWSERVSTEKAAWRRFRSVLHSDSPRGVADYALRNPGESILVATHVLRASLQRLRSKLK